MRFLPLIVVILIITASTLFFQSQLKTPAKTNTDEQVIASGLDTPWELVFLPDKSILVTERPGRVRLINPDNQLDPTPVLILTTSKEVGEGGLLGITLHPNFDSNHFVYLYYTYQSSGNNTFNKVSRFEYQDKKLINEKTILDNIPGAANHNGGRIKFGPDKNLYITTGDAQDPSQAQNQQSLAGKILRIKDDGSIPTDNPFSNSVYSYGHRNPQGIFWDQDNKLWETEHGRSGVLSGLDEINLIQKGKNYGWPTIQGDKSQVGMESPIKHSGPTTTWAPGDITYLNSNLYFVGLRGQAIYKTTLDSEKLSDIYEYKKNQYGRLREIILGPDNFLYITTSNNDGRGQAQTDDDKIIRLNPEILN